MSSISACPKLTAIKLFLAPVMIRLTTSLCCGCLLRWTTLFEHNHEHNHIVIRVRLVRKHFECSNYSLLFIFFKWTAKKSLWVTLGRAYSWENRSTHAASCLPLGHLFLNWQMKISLLEKPEEHRWNLKTRNSWTEEEADCLGDLVNTENQWERARQFRPFKNLFPLSVGHCGGIHEDIHGDGGNRLLCLRQATITGSEWRNGFRQGLNLREKLVQKCCCLFAHREQIALNA